MEISPILFCCTAKLVRSTLPCEKRCAEESFPRLRSMSSPQCFSANCAVPEPSERRAKTGLYKRTIFWTRKAFFGLSFFVGRWGAFLWYDFSEKAVMPIVRKRRAMTGFIRVPFLRGKPLLSCVLRRAVTEFYKRTILDVGARKRIQQSASQ